MMNKNKILRQTTDLNILFLFFGYTIFVIFFIQLIVFPLFFSHLIDQFGFLKTNDTHNKFKFFLSTALDIQNGQFGLKDIFTLINSGDGIYIIYLIFYFICFKVHYSIFLLNAIYHALSGFFLYLSLKEIFENKKYAFWGSIPFLIFFTPMNWYVQLLKDTTFILGFMIYFYGNICLLNSLYNSLKSYVRIFALFFLSIFFIFFSRPYFMENLIFIQTFYMFIILFYFLKKLIQHELSLKKFILKIFTFLILLFIFMPMPKNILTYLENAVYPSYVPDFKLKEIVNISALDTVSTVNTVNTVNSSIVNVRNFKESIPIQKESRYQLLLRNYPLLASIDSYFYKCLELIDGTRIGFSKSGGEVIDPTTRFFSLYDLLKYLPRAFQISLFSPFPNLLLKEGINTISNYSRKLVLIEMIIIYAILLFSPLVFLIRKNRFKIFASIYLLGTNCVVLSYVVTSIGTFQRLRYPFIMGIISIVIIAILKKIDDIKRKDFV